MKRIAVLSILILCGALATPANAFRTEFLPKANVKKLIPIAVKSGSRSTFRTAGLEFDTGTHQGIHMKLRLSSPDMPKYIPVLGWGAWGFVELISDLYETFIPFYDRTNNIAYVANCIVSVEDEDTKADTVSLRINRCAVKETAGATVQTINGVNVDDLYAWLVVERNGTGDAIPILVENPNF